MNFNKTPDATPVGVTGTKLTHYCSGWPTLLVRPKNGRSTSRCISTEQYMKRWSRTFTRILLCLLTLVLLTKYALYWWDRNIGNGPIDFYGVVVDDDGNPVVGATVDIRVEAVSMIPLPVARKTKYSLKTGAGGRFSITNEDGDFVLIESIEKRSTRQFGPTNQKDCSFYYGTRVVPDQPDYIPDPNHPHEFQVTTIPDFPPSPISTSQNGKITFLH